MTKELAKKRLVEIDQSIIELFEKYLEIIDTNDKKLETKEDYEEILKTLDKEIKSNIKRIKIYNNEKDMLIDIISK